MLAKFIPSCHANHILRSARGPTLGKCCVRNEETVRRFSLTNIKKQRNSRRKEKVVWNKLSGLAPVYHQEHKKQRGSNACMSLSSQKTQWAQTLSRFNMAWESATVTHWNSPEKCLFHHIHRFLLQRVSQLIIAPPLQWFSNQDIYLWGKVLRIFRMCIGMNSFYRNQFLCLSFHLCSHKLELPGNVYGLLVFKSPSPNIQNKASLPATPKFVWCVKCRVGNIHSLKHKIKELFSLISSRYPNDRHTPWVISYLSTTTQKITPKFSSWKTINTGS